MHAPRLLLFTLLLIGLFACALPTRTGESKRGMNEPDPETVAAATAVLDAFHTAAAHADGERYFACLADDAIFLGTDATEFRAFADPYFSAGRGWTYEAVERHVYLNSSGTTAWFDERLTNESYGECRGTGVLCLVDDRWRIVQYNLAIPVPNELAKDLVEMIRQGR